MEDFDTARQELQDKVVEQILSTVVLFAFLDDTEASSDLREREIDNLSLFGRVYASTLTDEQRADALNTLFGKENVEAAL